MEQGLLYFTQKEKVVISRIPAEHYIIYFEY